MEINENDIKFNILTYLVVLADPEVSVEVVKRGEKISMNSSTFKNTFATLLEFMKTLFDVDEEEMIEWSKDKNRLGKN